MKQDSKYLRESIVFYENRSFSSWEKNKFSDILSSKWVQSFESILR